MNNYNDLVGDTAPDHIFTIFKENQHTCKRQNIAKRDCRIGGENYISVKCTVTDSNNFLIYRGSLSVDL